MCFELIFFYALFLTIISNQYSSSLNNEDVSVIGMRVYLVECMFVTLVRLRFLISFRFILYYRLSVLWSECVPHNSYFET
jgi:hypothetical protein